MSTLLRRFYEEPLAQASYLLGCTRTKQALVVDPNRDIDQYIAAAESHGLRITDVTETHIHADYVSGSRELAGRTGARLHLSDAGTADWKYAFAGDAGANLLRDGDTIAIGELRVDVIHTPGHTPEHLTFLVTEPAGTGTPMGAFTGDFIFVGDVGRPDLLERAAGVAGTMREAAAQLFTSLRAFERFPDHLQIWPGHGAGSPCGKALGAVPQTTLGYERHVSWAFAERDRERFVQRVLEGQPEPPAYFAVMKRVNREGPALMETLPAPRVLGAAEITAALAGSATVIDVRDAASYARSHITGTVNVPLGKSFPIYAGSTIRYDRPACVLVAAGRRDQADSAIRQLRLIGLDEVWGYATWDSLEDWLSRSHAATSLAQVSVQELRTLMSTNGPQVVDVRNPYEWDAGHIEGATNIPLARLPERLRELDPTRPVVVHCETGGRSSVAASLLEAGGFGNVANLAGGYKAWEAANSDERWALSPERLATSD